MIPKTKSLDTGTVVTRKIKSTGSVLPLKKWLEMQSENDGKCFATMVFFCEG